MADLDDFFAKKDKKKSKGKKFTTTEELAKKLEEKKAEKPKKEKATFQSAIQNNAENDGSKPVGEEEEWREFEEEKKDYTGLKIQNLNLEEESKSDNGDGEAEGGEMEENEQGELVRKKKGPWNAVSQGEANGVQAPQSAPVEKKPVSLPSSAGKTYQAPHLRNPGMAPPTRTPRSMASVVAPDIMNQDFFPTLSAASNETPVSWNRKKQESAFEEVRNSKSHTNRDSRVSGQRLEIGNKFGALQNENS